MSIARLAQPKFLLLLFLAAFFGILAAGWGGSGLSDQELLANYAKAMDYLRGFQETGGWPWWTPFFNNGQSQAPALGTIFAYLPLILFSPLGAWAGSKAAVLIFGAASGLAMFAFAKALSRSEWTALACAMLYVLCPQFALRAAWNEHVVVAFCFLYPPLMCLALLRLREHSSTGAALILGVSTSAMFLTYAKIALVFIPAALLFACWLWSHERKNGGDFCKGILKAVGIFVPLGLLPLLPALRETGGLALFEFDPLQEWKHSFSLHSPLGFFDRGGWLSQGLPSGLFLDKAGSYAGVVVIVGIGWILFRRLEWSRRSPEAGPLRIFLAMTLLLFWFSLGPECLLLSFWHLLGNAQDVKDWVAPLFWMALAVPGFLMAGFWPWRGKLGIPMLVLTVAGFYLLPGFWVFELLTRIGDIRAPWSFWQVGGSFALAMVGGLSLEPLFRALQTRREQIGLGIVLSALALLDATVYEREFFKPGLEPGTAEEFRKAEEYLAGAKVPGSVFPVSGRYFYLMTPQMSGRPLVMEAFQSYLMPRFTKRLLDAMPASQDLFQGYLKTGGVAYILVDKEDAETATGAEGFFRGILPLVFEGSHFLIFENRNALSPAFFSSQIILFPSGDGFEQEMLSKAGLRNFLPIPWDGEGDVKSLPGVAGRMITSGETKGEFEMEEAFRTSKGTAFTPVKADPLKRPDPQRIFLTTTTTSPGWITVPESFHQDWQANLNGQPAAIYRGMGAFLSVPVGTGVQHLEFFFQPPFWYALCAWGSALSWFLLLPVAGGAACSTKFRRKVFAAEKPGSDFGALKGESGRENEKNRPIRKALVVVPCYNEAVSIAETVRQILQHGVVEILVVEDASPDGTAKIVETLPEFGSRIHLLQRSGKLGLASAYKEGFAWALQRDFEAVLEIDADLSHDPADISKLIGALDQGADMAIGSRYLDGVRVLNWPQHRLFLSLFAGSYTRLFTRLPLTDPTSGFKAIRRRVLEAMDWEGFEAEGYGFQIELHVRAWRQDFKLTEVPIVFTERRAGASKMSRHIALEAAGRVVELAFEKGRVKKP